MVGEIVFHLGDCKTGTTSIQGMLATGECASLQGGICYPTRFNHMPLARSLSVRQEMGHQEARFVKLRTAFDRSAAAFGVVSAEHFEFIDPQLLYDAIQKYLPGYEGRIRLVAYVRPHADRFLSTFAERCKKGLYDKSLDLFHANMLKQGGLVYTPRFEKWRALFGEAFSLRPFLRDRLYLNDVVQDFFSYLFDSEAFELPRPADRNESLSVEDIAMMRALHRRIRNQAQGPIDAQQAFGWYMSNFLGASSDPRGTKPQLHRALAEKIAEAYRADAAALDAAFFDGQPMSEALAAAPKKAVSKPQSFEAKDHFNPAERRRLRIWADFLLRLIEADPQHFMWAVRDPDQRSKLPPAPMT